MTRPTELAEPALRDDFLDWPASWHDLVQVPMDTVRVRPYFPGDREAVAALFASAGRRPANAISRRGCCVAVVDGLPERVIGFGAWWRVRLDKFRMDLLVAAKARRRGVGTRLLGQVVIGAHGAGAATLQARAGSENQESLEFLLERGFVETMRMHLQVLSVAEAKLTPYAHLPAMLAERGIVLVPLPREMARGEACWEEYARVFNAAREGWLDPDPGPVAPLTAAEFRRMHHASELEHGVSADQCLLAVRGTSYVGFTGAVGTAVDPAFRRQGIATALKLQAVIAARDRGATTMQTSTGHPGMLRVNERFGFSIVSTEVRLVRTIRTEQDVRA